MAAGLTEIEAMVARGMSAYGYYRRKRDYALFRRSSRDARLERLVDGAWASVDAPCDVGADGWEELDAQTLALHVQQYLLGDLDQPPVDEQGTRREQLRRFPFWLWLNPPLKGGASRRLVPGAAERSRRAYAELLEDVTEPELKELKEQALTGYEQQRQRSAGTEQRANFFLAASGLTSSLVLANGSLLLGTSKLHSPWLQLAAMALGVASFCAIAAGLRAMQAMMITFFRTPPNGVDRVFSRRLAGGDQLMRLYLAALLVAQARAGAIGDWKVNRLRGARRWFLAAIVGVVLLTAFVLAEALW